MELMTKEKKGFKRTELGDFPSDWSIKDLGNCTSKITDGTHDTPKKVQDGIPYITAIHVKQNNIDFDSCYYLPQEVHRLIFNRCNPSKGDVLMVNIGAGVGTTAVVNVDFEFSLKNVALVKPEQSMLSGEYLNYCFDYFKELIVNSLSSGGAQGFLSLAKISNIKIPLPPTLEEQQAIASVLSDVDELIRSLDRLVEKKEAIKKGAMQQLLTGKKRLPGFDGDWDVKALGDVCEIISGGTPSTRNSEYWDGNIKWCTPTDITSNKGKYLSNTSRKITEQGLKSSSATLLPKGTLLLCSRATVGEVKITTTEISTNQGFKSLICSESVDNEFLYYLIILKKQKFIDKAFGSTFLEISKKNTSDIEFDFPTVEEQKAIAQILSDMDRELQTLRQKREKMRRVKEGMMQELLTGKTKLINS